MSGAVYFWVMYMILSILALYGIVIAFYDRYSLYPRDTSHVLAMLTAWGIGWIAATMTFFVRECIWPKCCGRIKVNIE